MTYPSVELSSLLIDHSKVFSLQVLCHDRGSPMPGNIASEKAGKLHTFLFHAV